MMLNSGKTTGRGLIQNEWDFSLLCPQESMAAVGPSGPPLNVLKDEDSEKSEEWENKITITVPD